jgi:hypothetical protein
MSNSGRAAIAILVAGAILVLAGWLDGNVIRDIRRQASATFDPNGLALALSLGSLAVAGAVLLLGVLAWRSHSALVGAAYAIVGAFFAVLPVILWRVASHINGTPPLLPQPIAQAVSQIYDWSEGPLNAVGTIGAGMLLVGLLVIGRSFQGHSVGLISEPPTGNDGQPIRPAVSTLTPGATIPSPTPAKNGH